MPYKRKEDKAAQMRRYRERKKQQREQAKKELLKQFTPKQIKIELPTLHELIWGKPKPKKKSTIRPVKKR